MIGIARRQDIVDVSKYGAVGDGVTDDTDAIQSAINYASSIGGGTVFLDAKSYLVSALSINQGVTLKGTARNDGVYIKSKVIQQSNYVTNPLIRITGTFASRMIGTGIEDVTLYRANNNAGSILLKMDFCSFVYLSNVQIENGEKGCVVNECWDSNFYNVIIRGQNTSLIITNNEALGGTFYDNANNLKFFHLHIESFKRRAVEIIGSGSGSKRNNKIDFYSLKAEGLIDAITYSDACNIYIANSNNINFFGGHISSKSNSTLSSEFSLMHYAGGVEGSIVEGTDIASNGATPLDSAIKFSDLGSAGTANGGIEIHASTYISPIAINGLCHILPLTNDNTKASVTALIFKQSGFGVPSGTKFIVYDSSITSFTNAPVGVNFNNEFNVLNIKGRSGLLTGTAAAGSSNTITLGSTAIGNTDLYKNWTITLTGGTGSGQTRTITAYSSGKVATVNSNWDTVPDATSTYSIKYADGQRSEPKINFRHVSLPGYWELGRYTENGRLQFVNNSGSVEYGHLILYGDYETTSGLKRCTQFVGGGWDTGHLILGNYHIWVDGSGILRIKNGAPTSATDGTVVGTQT